MYPELETIIHQAEERYLDDQILDNFSTEINTLRERLIIYQLIRDNEITLFQGVADNLLHDYSQENPKNLEKSLKYWLLITRYCAIAMLLNNHEFLDRRLLEWLTDIIQTNELTAIQHALYNLLMKEITKLVTAKQLVYLQPFFDQAKTTLLTNQVLTQ